MIPIIFSIGNFVLYSLGFWLAIGLILAVFIGWKRLVELGLEEEKILDLLLLMIFFGFVGGRLVHVLENFKTFGFSFWKWLSLFRYPGLSLWGGAAVATLTAFQFSKKQKWDFWRIADELVFALLPFLLLVWVGIIFDGSVLGRGTGAPWGIFSHDSMVRRQPVAIFFSLGILGIWLFLLGIQRNWRSWGWLKNKNAGFLSLSATFLLAVLNFFLAFLLDIELYFLLLEIIFSFVFLAGTAILIVLRVKPKRK